MGDVEVGVGWRKGGVGFEGHEEVEWGDEEFVLVR